MARLPHLDGMAARALAADEFRQSFDGLVSLLVFANSRTYGDGMKIAPKALVDDGLLDVCLVRKTPRHRLLGFFPTVFTGRHLALPEVEYGRTGRLRVETDPVMDVYADGEYICRTPVEVSVAGKALKVIV